MENLAGRIHRHTEDLESVQVEIDCLLETVEAATYETKEKLAEYQALKRQAAIVLDSVSGGYENALGLFRQSDRLMERLRTVKVEHVELCRVAQSQAETQPDGAASELSELKRARQRLYEIYNQLKSMKTESLLVADSVEYEG